MVLGLLAAAAAARAEALLDVTGSVVATQPRLEVSVVVTNRGDLPAAPVDVTGELLGARDSARLAGPLAPGHSGAVQLAFEVTPPRPGVYALTLLLEHPQPGTPDAAGNPPMASQRAWLLVALGTNPAPAVRLTPRPLRLEVEGELQVRVESADRAVHRVRLRVLTARGLRSEGDPPVLEVPAAGPVTAQVTLVRAGAPQGTRHGVLLVAEALDGEAARTTVGVATVDVAADPALLPRWRGAVLVLALGMLLVVVAAELWRGRGGSALA